MKKRHFPFGHRDSACVCAVCLDASAQKKYDTGATDTEIKIGQTNPFSGPASSYATIGKTQAAYIKMINDQGGVTAARSIWSSMTTPIRRPRRSSRCASWSRATKVLHLPLSARPRTRRYQISQRQGRCRKHARDSASNSPTQKNFPWTMGFNPNYFVEGHIYGQYILKEYPNAKVGILYQNDDLGKDYLDGIKAGLGDKAAKMVVAEASYEVSDPTIDSQILKIKDAGADLFFSATTPKPAAQAIKKIHELNWSRCISSTSTPPRSAP